LGKVLVIGLGNYETASRVQWNQHFPNIEEFDSLIIDLTSFLKNKLDATIFDSLEELRRATRTFMRTNREIFCIIDEPISIDEASEINYAWFPFHERLSIIRKKPGKSKTVRNQRFAEYFKFVGEWNYEIYWKWISSFSFDFICVNKSGKAVAGTLTHGQSKIHLLPKTTKISVSDSIKLLIDLALGKELTEYPWRKEIETPGLQEIEAEMESKRVEIDLIKKEMKDLENKWKDRERYRDLFSKDAHKIPKAVQRILADLGIETRITPKGHVIDLISEKVGVEVTSIKGKINAKNKKVSQLSRFIEEERKEEKVIFVANTHKELPITERMGKEDITATMEKFLESVQVCFITTLTLYQLWMRVLKKEMSIKEASSLILTKVGVLRI
jgi:hypothetical protein